jgi:hypothetical protein
VELFLKLAVANLFQDIRVAGFIDFERFMAMRADDVFHDESVGCSSRSVNGKIVQ